MSTERNERAVRRIYDELWNERRLEVADELIAEGGRNYDTGLIAHPFGPEEMKGTVRMVSCGFPDNVHRIEEVIAEGDTVVARVTLTGTHEGEFIGLAPTGRRIAVPAMDLIRVRDGLAAEHWGVTDTATMMQQLGALPEDAPAG